MFTSLSLLATVLPKDQDDKDTLSQVLQFETDYDYC